MCIAIYVARYVQLDKWLYVFGFVYYIAIQLYVCIHTLGNGSVTNGMATVAISDLQCGVTYSLIAEGMSNGMFVGPASSHGNITTGPCPVMTSECIASCVYMYVIH